MELKGKKENIAIIEDNSFGVSTMKNGANCFNNNKWYQANRR
jgi:hypothetical protein